MAISTAVSRPSAPGQPRSFGRGRRKVSLRVAMRLSAARRNSSLIGAKRINRALRIILLFQSHRCSQFCPEGCAIKSIVCPWSASRRTKPGRQVADKSRFAWSRCRLSNPRASAAPPSVGGRFIATKPARSRCSTTRSAIMLAMISPALWTRLRPRKCSARAIVAAQKQSHRRVRRRWPARGVRSLSSRDESASDRTRQERGPPDRRTIGPPSPAFARLAREPRVENAQLVADNLRFTSGLLASGLSRSLRRHHPWRPSLQAFTVKSAKAFTRRCKCRLVGQARATVSGGTGLAIGRMTSGSPS